MTTMKMQTRWTLTALTALLVGAPGLEAQSAAPVTDEAKRVALAGQLAQQARDASEEMDTFKEASSLYRQAAETLGDHPDAADHLVHAGRLAYYTGDERRAIEDFRAAGERALEWGDVLVAAQAFLDAAWVAAEEERGAEAMELAQRAERLSSSPLIQRQERASLLSRIADLQQQD
jgi:tetratricopeptide (TPR) repeat protein